MKTFFATLFLLLVSASGLYAGVPIGEVPEPSSLILMGAGIAGVVLWLRKRR